MRTDDVGRRVKARYKKSPEGQWSDKWHPGVVKRVHSDSTAAIDYDDGDKMEHVPAACIEFLSPQVRGGAPQASGGGGGTDPRIAQDQDPFSFQNTAWKQDVIFWYRCSFGDFRRAGRSHGAKSKFSTVDCARIVEGVACQRTSRAGCPSFRIFLEFILHGVPIRVLEIT